MQYENKTLTPSLHYLWNYAKYVEQLEDAYDGGEADPSDMYDRLERLRNGMAGVYRLLCNRYTVLQLRTDLSKDSGSKKEQQQKQALLTFLEGKIHGHHEGIVQSDVMQEWIAAFDKQHSVAVMKSTANAAAYGRKPWGDKDKQDRDGRGKGKGKGKGKGGEPADAP
jgi:hypothetical protein